MRKYNILLLTVVLPFFIFAQPVQFNLSNKASLSFNGADTLKFPFTGGLNAPQFSKIDLNGDGIKDLFVFDRIGSKVMTYVFSNGNYVYAPAYESQFPQLYKWAVLYDYNCDGKEDIITEVDYNAQPEKDKFISSNGIRVIRNVSTVAGNLKWKQDKNQLMDIGLDVLPPSNISVSNSDISAFNDIDGDGDMDMLTMPTGKNVITYYQNQSKEMGYNCDSLKFLFRDECWGYMSYLVNTNAFLLNDKSACYRNYKTAKHNGTTLSLFDADNDGDKDLIYGDVGFQSLIYLENGRSISPLGRDSMLSQDTLFPKNSVQAKMETFPASFILDVDGDGKKDMLIAPNAESAAKNKIQVMYYKNTGTATIPNFTYQNSTFLVGQMLDLGGGSIPVFVDIDVDGDQDLVISTQGEYTQTFNSNDRLYLFKNMGTSTKANFVLTDSNFLNINGGAIKIQRMVPTFGDLNGDNKPDLLIGDLNGKMHYFQNTTVGVNITFNKQSNDYFTIFGGTSAAPQLVDLNKDGKLDIVMGRKNGTLAYFENAGTTTAPNFTSAPSIDSIGKITVAEKIMSGGVPYYFDGYSIPHVCDLDKDGKYEVLVGCDLGRMFLFRNFEASASRVCEEVENIYSDGAGVAPSNLSFGPKTSATTFDLDGDNKPELMIGNLRGGVRLYTADIKGIVSGVPAQVYQVSNWLLYPNPARTNLTIRTDKNMQEMPYVVYDILGNNIATGSMNAYETSIGLNQFKPGFYVIRSADNKGNQYVAKFLVEE